MAPSQFSVLISVSQHKVYDPRNSLICGHVFFFLILSKQFKCDDAQYVPEKGQKPIRPFQDGQRPPKTSGWSRRGIGQRIAANPAPILQSTREEEGGYTRYTEFGES
jgi:hypothetical protein